MNKTLKTVLLSLSVCLFALLLLILTMFITSGAIQLSANKYISPHDSLDIPEGDYDAIVVFGAGVKDNGQPSDMLYDRVYTATLVYKSGACKKILMSGDRTGDYNEPDVMKELAVSLGVSEEDILVDYEGYSTGETVQRAAENFDIKKAILVTQKYHLGRALYISRRIGIEAVAVSADVRTYQNQIVREAREVLARTKDFYAFP